MWLMLSLLVPPSPGLLHAETKDAKSPAAKSVKAIKPQVKAATPAAKPAPPPVAKPAPQPTTQPAAKPIAKGKPKSAPMATVLPPADRPITQVINEAIAANLKGAKVTPAPFVDDAAFIRRLTLDLAGRIPRPDEVQEYAASKAADKKEKLVDRLLASPDYAFHHRNELDALLLAEKRNDGKWREYLLKAARENRPWDQLFREMMVGREDREEERPALEFLKARTDNLDDLTNDTSRFFFGVSISCAKCHDHPLAIDWKQDHYFGLASFFSRTYLTKTKKLAEKPSGQVRFKTTAGIDKVASFMFLTGTVVAEPERKKTKEELKKEEDEVRKQMQDDKAGPVTLPDFSPRTKLVEVALRAPENQMFARAIANRIWARFFNQGIVHPVDQMHSGNVASHPELLDWLARDLISHKYDLKRLMRGIVLSEAYARSSTWNGPGEPPPQELFAVWQVKPLSPRQYAAALTLAAGGPKSYMANPKPELWNNLRNNLENAANGWAGEIERPGENFQVSVDEALLFSNSPRFVNDFLRDSGDRLVGHLKSLPSLDEKIAVAYRHILSREPREDEKKAIVDYLSARGDRPIPALQQVVWALLTSPEMRFNY